MSPRSHRLFKICSAGEWQSALQKTAFEGSAADRRDGFIHLSDKYQAPDTLLRYFSGKRGLVLLEIDSTLLDERELKWEPSRGGQLFPHLYGELAIDKVRHVTAIPDTGREDFMREVL